MATPPMTYGQPDAPAGVRLLSTPKPLTSAEIRQQLIYRMAEAMLRTIFVGQDPLPQELLNEIVASMDQHIIGCNLNGKAYSDYTAKWTLHVTYNNFGRAIEDHFEGSVVHGELGAGADTETIHVEIDQEPIPPNLARVECEQEVPVASAGRGATRINYPKPEKTSAKVTRK